MQNMNTRIPDSAGFILNNLQVRIVDTATGEDLGPNKVGEVWLKSPVLMTGYYKNPQGTEETIDNEGNKASLLQIFYSIFQFFYKP